MKHFFFFRNNGGMLDTLLKEDFSGKDEVELYKYIYDITDILHDKRLEKKDDGSLDSELNDFFNLDKKTPGSVKDEICKCEALNEYKKVSTKLGLLEALKMLWVFTESRWDDKKQSLRSVEGTENNFTYLLCCGNIALRIAQQYYYAECNLPKAEYWGERTMEIIWHGKNLIKNGSSIDPTLKYAMDLLLAKYYRDYARRNRRSSFINAEKEYQKILDEIYSNYFDDNLPKKVDDSKKKQLFMIWMEALYNFFSIQRHIHSNEEVYEYAAITYVLAEKIIELQKEPTTLVCEEIRSIIKFTEEVAKEEIKEIKNEREREQPKDKGCIRKNREYILKLYNIKMGFFANDLQGNYNILRYFLLVLLDLSRIFRDQLTTESCKSAIKVANHANCLSKEMDKLLTPEGINDNMDAMIVLSTALQKYIEYANETELKDIKEHNYGVEIDGKKTSVNIVMDRMKLYADSGHFSSKTELIRWYCLGLKHKDMSENRNLPTKITIDGYLDKEDANIELKMHKARVLLASRQFEEVERLCLRMLEDHKDETYYIRKGSRGLEINYLLSNAYISLGNITMAKTILYNLYNKLKEAKEEIHNSANGRKGGYDIRVIMDLIYCYMRQGDYDEAYHLYKLHQEKSMQRAKEDNKENEENNQKVVKDGDDEEIINEYIPENIKINTRLNMINNLIGCCILSIDDSIYETTIYKTYDDEVSKEKLKKYGEKKEEYREKLHTALMAFEYLKKNNLGYEKNRETNLYKGYFVLLTEPLLNKILFRESLKETLPKLERFIREQESEVSKETNVQSIEVTSDNDRCLLNTMLHAQYYFKKACHYEEGFIFRYKTELEDEREDVKTIKMDKAQVHHEISYVSAYIINLVRIYQVANKFKNTKVENDAIDELKKMLIGFPKNYRISLKAAIALAEWILDIENHKEKLLVKDSLDKLSGEVKKAEEDRIVEELYGSFGFVTTYEEEGAASFNQLRDNHSFRLLGSTERARIMAHLLAMYKPIKAIKEECSFHLGSKLKNGNEFHLVHYTSLDTLKALVQGGSSRIQSDEKSEQENELNRLLEQTKKEARDNPDLISGVQELKYTIQNYLRMNRENQKKAKEPRFRISSCGYVNDVFEGRTFLNCMQSVVVPSKKEDDGKNDNQNGETDEEKEQKDFREFVRRYFPQLKRSAENMQPSSSDVYIASLSVKDDSFPMWSIYAKDEAGCNIEFGKNFFDIHGSICYPCSLRPYVMSTYTDQDYPLYLVQYIGSQFKEVRKEHSPIGEKLEDYTIQEASDYWQACKTRAMKYKDLCRLLDQVYHRWHDLDNCLNNILPDTNKETNSADTKPQKESEQFDGLMHSLETIRHFAADRLNEVRFLFKNSDYEFEGEVRVVYTDSSEQSCAKTDYNRTVPLVYVDMNRDLKGLTVRLGSKIDDITVDRIVSWLKHTNRVDKVMLAERNRYTSRHLPLPDKNQQ